MSAYVVFTREQTTDAEELAQYAQKAPLAREGRELTPLRSSKTAVTVGMPVSLSKTTLKHNAERVA